MNNNDIKQNEFIIGGLKKLSLIDFKGKIACVVFTSGCLFRCPWCYNPQLVLPNLMKENKKLEHKEFFDFLDTKKNIINGVVVCGGEPTLQPGLKSFCKKLKERGLYVKVDTMGHRKDIIIELIEEGLVDYVAVDIKGTFNKVFKSKITKDENYEFNYMGLYNYLIKQDLIDYEYRITCVNGFHTAEDIIDACKNVNGSKIIYLQNYIKSEKIVDMSKINIFKSFKVNEMKKIAHELMSKYGCLDVKLR